jgi:hypothetical protein
MICNSLHSGKKPLINCDMHAVNIPSNKMGTQTLLIHTKVPPSIVSKECIAYYQSVAANAYIQHVLPGFRLSLQHCPSGAIDDDNKDNDQLWSNRMYWETVASNVPDVSLACACELSYGTNVLAMMFAFGHSILAGYDQKGHLDLSLAQALAIHQASGLVDAVSYLHTTTATGRVQYFGTFYWPLVNVYTWATDTHILLFILLAVLLDTVHHLLHALASLWRFAGTPSIVWYKGWYHIYHWAALVLSFPTRIVTMDGSWNTRICASWKASHTYELLGHTSNDTCRILK